jgi:hypothetical protein
MRVLASATPLAGEKWKVIAIGDDEHVGDVRLIAHRTLDRHRHRHGVTVLGDLGKVELDAALRRRLAAGELLDQVVGIVGGVRWARRSGQCRCDDGAADGQTSVQNLTAIKRRRHLISSFSGPFPAACARRRTYSFISNY